MATGTPVTYKVTTVTTNTQFTGAATPVTGKTVSFETSIGYIGTVFVPDGVFSDQAAVRALIEDQVKLVAAAQMIAGSVSS
jgi:hypothetical protein